MNKINFINIFLGNPTVCEPKVLEIDALDKKIQALADNFFGKTSDAHVEELAKNIYMLKKLIEFPLSDPLNKKDNVDTLTKVCKIFSEIIEPKITKETPLLVRQAAASFIDYLEKDYLRFASSLQTDPEFAFNLEVQGKTFNFKGMGIDNSGMLVGMGRSGRVFLGKDPTSGKEIAVKVVSQSSNPNEGRFLLDMQGCKYVVNGIAVESAKTLTFIVMEKIPGVAFSQRISGAARPNLQETIHILQQIATGVKELHSKGIIHGDLHPENILVDTKTGRVKIIDLGSSEKIEAHDTSSSQNPTFDEDAVALMIHLAILGGTFTELLKIGKVPELKLAQDENFYYSFPSEVTSLEDCLILKLLRHEKAAKKMGALITSRKGRSLKKIIQELQEIETLVK